MRKLKSYSYPVISLPACQTIFHIHSSQILKEKNEWFHHLCAPCKYIRSLPQWIRIKHNPPSYLFATLNGEHEFLKLNVLSKERSADHCVMTGSFGRPVEVILTDLNGERGGRACTICSKFLFKILNITTEGHCVLGKGQDKDCRQEDSTLPDGCTLPKQTFIKDTNKEISHTR